MEEKQVPNVVIDADDIPIFQNMYLNESKPLLQLDSYFNIRGNLNNFTSPIDVFSLFRDFTSTETITLEQVNMILSYYGYIQKDANNLYNQLIHDSDKLTYEQFAKTLKLNNDNISEEYKGFLFSLVNKPHRYTIQNSVKLKIDTLYAQQKDLTLDEPLIHQENEHETVKSIIRQYGALLFATNKPHNKWIKYFLELATWCTTGNDIFVPFIACCLSIFIFRFGTPQTNDQILKFLFDIIWNNNKIDGVRYDCLIHISRHLLAKQHCVVRFCQKLSSKISSCANTNNIHICIYLFSYIAALVINPKWMKQGKNGLQFISILTGVLALIFSKSDEIAKKQAALILKLLAFKKISVVTSANNQLMNCVRKYFALIPDIVDNNNNNNNKSTLDFMRLNELNDRILQAMKYELFAQQNDDSSDIDYDTDEEELQMLLGRAMHSNMACGISNLAVSYMSGVVLYVLGELLDVSGEETKKTRKERIEFNHMNKMLANDEEIRSTFLHLLPIERLEFDEGEGDDNTNDEPVKFHASFYGASKPSKCYICKKGFKNEKSLNHHNTKIHGEE